MVLFKNENACENVYIGKLQKKSRPPKYWIPLYMRQDNRQALHKRSFYNLCFKIAK